MRANFCLAIMGVLVACVSEPAKESETEQKFRSEEEYYEELVDLTETALELASAYHNIYWDSSYSYAEVIQTEDSVERTLAEVLIVASKLGDLDTLTSLGKAIEGQISRTIHFFETLQRATPYVRNTKKRTYESDYHFYLMSDSLESERVRSDSVFNQARESFVSTYHIKPRLRLTKTILKWDSYKPDPNKLK